MPITESDHPCALAVWTLIREDEKIVNPEDLIRKTDPESASFVSGGIVGAGRGVGGSGERASANGGTKKKRSAKNDGNSNLVAPNLLAAPVWAQHNVYDKRKIYECDVEKREALLTSLLTLITSDLAVEDRDLGTLWSGSFSELFRVPSDLGPQLSRRKKESCAEGLPSLARWSVDLGVFRLVLLVRVDQDRGPRLVANPARTGRLFYGEQPVEVGEDPIPVPGGGRQWQRWRI